MHAAAPSRFVLGTGRCGSTLLSQMLARHPDVLSAAELFTMAQPRAFPRGAIDGEQFWQTIAEPRAGATFLLRHGLEPQEFRYPVDDGRRFDRESGVPPIALICLASLTDDPDALYDELERPIRALSPAPAGKQYRALLELLATLVGRRIWVERSGGSLAYAGDIAEQFDRPKVVHLYRDGPDTALSMSHHSSYRMMMLRRLGHDALDLRTFRETPIPAERYGRTWSATVLRGTRQLVALPAGDVLHLSYEQLLANPVGELSRVAEQLELPDARGGWLEQAADAVGPPGDKPSAALGDAELERLRRACAPGERRLRELVAGDRSP